jgi:hypothetical protein
MRAETCLNLRGCFGHLRGCECLCHINPRYLSRSCYDDLAEFGGRLAALLAALTARYLDSTILYASLRNIRLENFEIKDFSLSYFES